MVYRFVDIHQPAESTPGLETILNGSNLDQAYAGKFKTLIVNGRGLIAPSLKTTDKVGNHGSWFDSSFYKERILEISAEVSTDRSFLEELNYLLGCKQNALIFTDDADWYWNAYLSDMSFPDEVHQTGIAKIAFASLSPYKLSVQDRSSTGQVTGTNDYPMYLKEIRVDITTNTSRLVIKNNTNGQAIVVEHDFVVGDKVFLDFPAFAIKKNTQQNILRDLNINSDFETFTVKRGDEISADQSFTITYKETAL